MPEPVVDRRPVVSAPPVARLQQLAGRTSGPALGLLGQVLNAGTNVVTAYVASLLLGPDTFGTFVLGFACVTVVMAAGRGLIGTTMMVHLPTLEEPARRAAVRSALGLTVIAGLAAAALLGVLGTWWPVLWAFAPWVAVAMLQDVGRYAHLSEGRPGRALGLDVAWALVQAATLLVGVSTGAVTVGLVAAAWGLGALAGLVLFLGRLRLVPAPPGAWARATRDVAGWFTAVAVLGQIEVYLVLLLTGVLLAPADVGGVRTVQLLAYQPAVVVLAALMVVVQPIAVRARTSPDALREASKKISLFVAPIIAGLVVLALLREPVMALFFGQYTAYAPLVVPIAIQSAFVALAIAPLTVLNGLRRGATAFRMQLLRTAATVAAAVIGMELAGVVGLAWALATATALTWIQTTVAARRAVSLVGANA